MSPADRIELREQTYREDNPNLPQKVWRRIQGETLVSWLIQGFEVFYLPRPREGMTLHGAFALARHLSVHRYLLFDRTEAMAIKKNDWVRSYSAGVWRVVSEVPAHYEMRTSPDEPKELYDGPLFIVKRIVNNKWKRAFETEAAHAAFIKPLNKADTKKLETFVSQNDGILDEFASFTRPLHCLLNIGFALKRKSDLKKLRDEVAAVLGDDLAKGVSAPAIAKAISLTSYAALCNKSPQSGTLQFVNFNYEVRRREFIYREMNALNF